MVAPTSVDQRAERSKKINELLQMVDNVVAEEAAVIKKKKKGLRSYFPSPSTFFPKLCFKMDVSDGVNSQTFTADLSLKVVEEGSPEDQLAQLAKELRKSIAELNAERARLSLCADVAITVAALYVGWKLLVHFSW